MSLRLKTLATFNALGWLVAVPLLIAALLSPIVGFNGWQDRLLPGDRADTVRLADAPRHAPARVAAAPQRGRTAGRRGRDRCAPALARARRERARRSAQPCGRTAPRRRAASAADAARPQRACTGRGGRLCRRLHPPRRLRSPSR